MKHKEEVCKRRMMMRRRDKKHKTQSLQVESSQTVQAETVMIMTTLDEPIWLNSIYANV